MLQNDHVRIPLSRREDFTKWQLTVYDKFVSRSGDSPFSDEHERARICSRDSRYHYERLWSN